jgi:hypothetical protein
LCPPQRSSTIQLLKKHTIEDLYTVVYTVIDDFIEQSLEANRFCLPKSNTQKASYSEILTIALVGEILNQAKAGVWFLITKNHFMHLFRELPDVTRYYRILRNLEQIMADFALCLANTVDDGTTYSADSKPISVCHIKRYKFPRAMTEATKGYGTMGGVFGFKLHAIASNTTILCRFAIVPANEADITVARALLNPDYDELDRIVGDKAYVGLGIFTPPKANAKHPVPWTRLMNSARKIIETVFSSLTRSKHLVLGQLDSFWSIRRVFVARLQLTIWAFGWGYDPLALDVFRCLRTCLISGSRLRKTFQTIENT